MTSDILTVLSEADDGVYAVDMDQKIIFWNRAAERILGHGAQEMLGRPCYEAIRGRSEEGQDVCGGNCASVLMARQARVAPSSTLRVPSSGDEPKWISV